MTTQLSEFPLPGFLWSCFIQARNYSYIWYLGVFSDHYFGNTADESGRSFFFLFFFLSVHNNAGAEVTQKILTVAPVSAGGVVCLELEWKQPVIHD